MSKEALIQEKVEDFIRNDRLFTSVDVANSLKTDGVRVRNVEVAAWLRSNRDDSDIFGDYENEMINVCNGTQRATLYYPTWSDIDDYTETDQTALPLPSDKKKKIKKTIQQKPFVAPKTQDISSIFDDTDDNIVMSKVIKTTERIKIPSAMIREIGWGPGDTVDTSFIKTHNQLPDNLVVNSDCRVSIPRTAVNWKKKPVKVMLTKDNEIIFDKA